MAVKRTSDVVKQWSKGMQGSTEKYKAGIQAVTESPGRSAARKVDLWAQKVAEAAQNGRYVDGCNSVSLPEWQQKASTLGSQRLAQGAMAAEGKMTAFYDQLLPYVESVRQSLSERGTLSQNIDRMVQNAQKMSEFRYRKNK